MQIYIKDPDAVLPYKIDWSDWLPTGDTISASIWEVPAGLTNDADEFTTTDATILVSGGTVDTDYTITNRITTAEGLTDDRSILLKIRER